VKKTISIYLVGVYREWYSGEKGVSRLDKKKIQGMVKMLVLILQASGVES